MEENKDYRAYRYGDKLTPGRDLEIKHSIRCENMDISALVKQDQETLQTMRRDSIDSEQKAFDIVVAAANQWEQQAAVTQAIDQALEYLRIPEVKHTANRWQGCQRDGGWDEISNRVYKMSSQIREVTKYNKETKEMEPVSWDVSWDLYVQSPKQRYKYGEKIAGQKDKHYKDKAAAEKYLEGRKKAYSHLFEEISPLVPEEYAHHFTVNGVLLPGYTIEGQEQEKKMAGHTTASISEGGISAPGKEEKPSVLGKLSAVKVQEKAGREPNAVNKRKEDMQI